MTTPTTARKPRRKPLSLVQPEPLANTADLSTLQVGQIVSSVAEAHALVRFYIGGMQWEGEAPRELTRSFAVLDEMRTALEEWLA
jgi:hypothetical protein